MLYPLGDNIIVRPIQQEQVRSSGIVIPDTAQEQAWRGEVLAIGPIDNINLDVGDVVLYRKYAGQETKVDDETLVVLELRNLIAKEK